jgi:hypothetical protein
MINQNIETIETIDLHAVTGGADVPQYLSPYPPGYVPAWAAHPTSVAQSPNMWPHTV